MSSIEKRSQKIKSLLYFACFLMAALAHYHFIDADNDKAQKEKMELVKTDLKEKKNSPYDRNQAVQ